MDPNAIATVAAALVTALFGGLGTWIKSISSSLREHKEAHSRLELKLAEQYIHKDVFGDVIRELKDIMLRVETKLDLKEDKA